MSQSISQDSKGGQRGLPQCVRVGVVDYGAGNYESVARALRALLREPLRVSDADTGAEIEKSGSLTHLIFPGVGRASQAMKSINERGLDTFIRKHVSANKPLLGICVGMQVLGHWSEEDDTSCLGLLPFRLSHFKTSQPVPHMGWNPCEFVPGQDTTQVFGQFVQRPAHFYFVHSYAALLSEASPDCVVAKTTYAGIEFASVVGQANILGTQFHVEKSGQAGLAFLQEFLSAQKLELNPCSRNA